MFGSMFVLMGMMIIVMLIGMVLRKMNIITDEGKKCITDLLIDVILPANTIKAFTTSIDNDVWAQLSMVFVLAMLAQVVAMIVAKVVYGRLDSQNQAVYRYGTICPNAGFIGYPLAQGVFGDIGLLYASIFLIPQRIMMFSAGIAYFSGEADMKRVFKQVVTHPCVVGTMIGIVLMLTQVKLPSVIVSVLTQLSNCNTALSFLVIGTILAQIDFKKMMSVRQFLFALLRLVGMPALLWAICIALKFDAVATGVAVLLTATPAGATTSILAAKYNCNVEEATKAVVLTTLFSMATIPLWSMLLIG